MSTATGKLEGMVRSTNMRSWLRNVTQSLHRSDRWLGRAARV
jgi:hypothetical protein